MASLRSWPPILAAAVGAIKKHDLQHNHSRQKTENEASSAVAAVLVRVVVAGDELETDRRRLKSVEEA